MKQTIEAIATNFIKTLQSRTSFEELTRFYHPGVRHTEFPNTLTKNKLVRNLNDLREASERGKAVLAKEEYEIIKTYSSGNTVVIEAVWTGTLAMPIGNIPVGGQMKAYFAQFFEFEGDRIINQRNYDCFEPFT